MIDQIILDKKVIGKHLIILTLIYFSAHYMLLLATGRWWDDLCLYNLDIYALKLWGSQMGRPSVAYIFYFADNAPESLYRILTFIMFYIISIIYYIILKYILKFSNEASCWISIFFSICPVNDARIMLAIFPYTIAVFCYSIGLFLLLYSLEYNKKSIFMRLMSLVLLFLSFTMNSNVCLFGTAIFAILKYNSKIKDNIKYLDFYFLPLIFLTIKKLFFEPYGAYINYNKIDIKSLILGLKNTFLSMGYIIISVFKNALSLYNVNSIIFAILFFIIIAILFAKNKKVIINSIKRNNCSVLIGAITLYLALYPYVVVRKNFKIISSGINGRDAVLVPFGVAILMYFILDLFFSDRLKKIVSIIFICGSIIFFNIHYWSYQADYYSNIGLQYQLKQHSIINNLQNIICLNSDKRKIKTWSFYCLNTYAEKVFKNQKRIMIDSKSFYDYYMNINNNSDSLKNPWYHMKETNFNYKKIELIIYYSCKLSLQETLKLKYYEMFNNKIFNKYIENKSKMTLYIPDDNYIKNLVF